MKEREYYEQLISDSLDRELTAGERDELDQATRQTPELAVFRDALVEQARVMRSLPEMKFDRALTPSAARPHWRCRLRSLWSYRMSVPLPAAAAIVLIALGGFAVNLSNSSSRIADDEPVRQTPIRYEQIVRLEPARATIVDQNELDTQFKEETL